MGIFEDVSRFFETRLDEFLRNNPQLELSILEEQLQQQEEGTLRLISEEQLREKQLQDDILATAQEIQRWHARIEKAKAANRWDLVEPAQAREASLLRQGNQLWGKMQGCKERITKAQELVRQIQQRRQEVKAKATEFQAAKAQAKAKQNWEAPPGWNQSFAASRDAADPLEERFNRWETESELDEMKRNLGR
ncbi:MAG: TIGR04376 family protein [Desertifilum sp. SIO1I2]|nr:TIGR04376 family protein [Desertifilum sp. SIO1I2]